MYLIRQLASKYKLTRTALLHYDSIGLLSASSRTKAGYRLYTEEDEEKLQTILLFRSMGISLDMIKLLINNNESKIANSLLIRLGELNQEIEKLQTQQKNIINLLKDINIVEQFLDKDSSNKISTILLEGISPLDWHEQFEKISPINVLVSGLHS